MVKESCRFDPPGFSAPHARKAEKIRFSLRRPGKFCDGVRQLAAQKQFAPEADRGGSRGVARDGERMGNRSKISDRREFRDARELYAGPALQTVLRHGGPVHSPGLPADAMAREKTSGFYLM